MGKISNDYAKVEGATSSTRKIQIKSCTRLGHQGERGLASGRSRTAAEERALIYRPFNDLYFYKYRDLSLTERNAPQVDLYVFL